MLGGIYNAVTSDMHLTRLYIKGYGSIKELDLHFDKGKNVLVGRNNVGKSNIVKALDLLLGEASPTYIKSDNVSENDFYSWKATVNGEVETRSTNEIFIWCELKREPAEALNYEAIYRCFGYYIWASVRYENNRPIREPKRLPRTELKKGKGKPTLHANSPLKADN